MDIDQDTIKKYAWHLKVMGAYVQQPVPAIVGLDERSIIGSADAAALYPTGIIHQNIGFDTIRHRVYDTAVVRKIFSLIADAFMRRADDPSAVRSAIFGFRNALELILKEYFKNKAVQNKKEAKEFTLEYYPFLLERLLSYKGKLEDIYSPIDDETYYLLKSCVYPIVETISWLSPQNAGYNQMLVDYVFFNEDFINKPRDIYMFSDINSTKTQFKIIPFQEGLATFKKYIINPYGILFDKHDDNLSYDVELLMEALSKRRTIKNQMQVLKAILKKWDSLSEESLSYFYTVNLKNITKDQAISILIDIKDSEDRDKRVEALTSFEFNCPDSSTIKTFIELRISQLNIVQLGIKVAANSAYGIFGLITWPFANPLIGNAITNAGKIYGIKLFQAVTVDTLNRIENRT